MKTSESFLEHYKGNESFVARVQDWINQAERYHKPIVTPFLNETECFIVEKICGKQIPYRFDGGSKDATLKRVIFFDEDGFSLVVCLVATFNTKFETISHRDVLGSLMNIGIERNQIGDLWVDDNRIVCYTTDTQGDYIIQNCTRIKRSSIQFSESPIHYEQVIKKEKFTVTISSERLDNVVSAMMQKSRTIAQEYIQSQKVRVNHEILEETSKLCNNGDTISIRGVGKFIYLGKIKTTRKDRYLVEFEKYR
jgi:RNA-binding protein YlmH